MSSGTITSVYQMRKRRYPVDQAVEAVRPNRKHITKITAPSTSQLISKSPKPISPNVRRSVRDTSMTFLCSQSDSQPEISWNCNSPEFHNLKPKRRAVEKDSDNIDMLSLIHNTFNTTPFKKTEEKKNNLLALWMAPTAESSSHLPKSEQSTFTDHKTKAVKCHAGKELDRLVLKVNRNTEGQPHPVNALPKSATEFKNCSERLNVVGPHPSTSTAGCIGNHKMENGLDPTFHLDNGDNNVVELPQPKKEMNANLSDVWSDEDLFNDEAFIEQTQNPMAAKVEFSNSQAPTQKLEIVEETINSDGEMQINLTVDVQNPLQTSTTTEYLFTSIRNPAVDCNTAPSKLTSPLTVKSEEKRKNDTSDDFWNTDDGFDEIICTLGDIPNKEDSLDYLMNCDTQPYPATNEEASASNSSATLEHPTQIMDENIDKSTLAERLHESLQKTTRKLLPLPLSGEGKNDAEIGRIPIEPFFAAVPGPSKPKVPSNESLEMAPKASLQKSTRKLLMLSAEGKNDAEIGRIPIEPFFAAVPGPSKPTVPSNESLENPITSKIVPPKSNGRRYTAEEIERKRLEAIERRRQKLEQSKQPGRYKVIYSQIMPPANIK